MLQPVSGTGRWVRMLTCCERHLDHEPPPDLMHFRASGAPPPHTPGPRRGCGWRHRRAPRREQSADGLLASSPCPPPPPDSHTLGTSSPKDHQQSRARGLKLQVLGEALFPTPARTGNVSDLRTLDHGMGIHGPSHPWLGLRATPHSTPCPQVAETVPAPARDGARSRSAPM